MHATKSNIWGNRSKTHAHQAADLFQTGRSGHRNAELGQSTRRPFFSQGASTNAKEGEPGTDSTRQRNSNKSITAHKRKGLSPLQSPVW